MHLSRSEYSFATGSTKFYIARCTLCLPRYQHLIAILVAGVAFSQPTGREAAEGEVVTLIIARAIKLRRIRKYTPLARRSKSLPGQLGPLRLSARARAPFMGVNRRDGGGWGAIFELFSTSVHADVYRR